MAKIDKVGGTGAPAGANGSSNGNNDEQKKEPTIDELYAEYNKNAEQIKRILASKPDKNDLKDQDKAELRKLYTALSRIARKISERVSDHDKAKQYKEASRKAAEKAASYGSVIKSGVPKTTMEDIKGLDNVKELVKSFLFMAQNPQLLSHYHMEGGLGMLLYGAPGTGKTMFAEAVANAMGLPLFVVTPADIFKSYVGQSEAAVREIFDEIDACEDGAILFIDECESIFTTRKADTQDYKSAVTTELLQRMNGFGVNGAKRIMIAATNRPDQIDSAYLRFKRFSHLVHVTPPDRAARAALVKGKLKGIDLAPDVTVEWILDLADKCCAPKTEASPAAANTYGAGSYGAGAYGAGAYGAGAYGAAAYAPDGVDRAIAMERAAEAESDDYAQSYYSAADMCAIIEEACRKALVQIEMNKGSQPIPLTREMFEAAFDKIKPSIKASVLKMYDDFRK